MPYPVYVGCKNILQVQKWYRSPLLPCHVWWGFDFTRGWKNSILLFVTGSINAAQSLVFKLLSGPFWGFWLCRGDPLHWWKWHLVWSKGHLLHAKFHTNSEGVGCRPQNNQFYVLSERKCPRGVYPLCTSFTKFSAFVGSSSTRQLFKLGGFAWGICLRGSRVMRV